MPRPSAPSAPVGSAKAPPPVEQPPHAGPPSGHPGPPPPVHSGPPPAHSGLPHAHFGAIPAHSEPPHEHSGPHHGHSESIAHSGPHHAHSEPPHGHSEPHHGHSESIAHSGPHHAHSEPPHAHSEPPHGHSEPPHGHSGPPHEHPGPHHAHSMSTAHSGPPHAHSESPHAHSEPPHGHTGPPHGHHAGHHHALSTGGPDPSAAPHEQPPHSEHPTRHSGGAPPENHDPNAPPAPTSEEFKRRTFNSRNPLGSNSRTSSWQLKPKSIVIDEKPPTKAELINWYAIEPVHLPKFITFLCNYIMIYETLICLMLCINLIFFPYDCFFNIHDRGLANFVYILDPIYAVDVILRLIVEEWRNRTKTKCMVFMFPYSLHYCLMDVLSLCPLHRLYLLYTDENEYTFEDMDTAEIMEILTLLRIYRVWIFFHQLEVNGLVYETIIFVVKFSIIYLSFILLVSVGYFSYTNVEEVEYFLLTRNRDKLTGTWAEKFLNNNLTDTPLGFFILSINFATIVVTTVGYGDIAPKTEAEMFGSILVMLVGAIFLAGYFQSQITSFCLQLDGARLDLFHRLDGIKIALRQAKMGEFFVAKVEQYYKCLWTYREGTDRVVFMQQLPISFQEDISYDVCLEMFHNSFLFQGLDEAFLRAVSKIVVISLYNPGMIVCQYGGYANKMYYIIQGECQAMSKHDLAKRAAILRAGSIIGETNLFFSCPYTVSVETRVCCQIMCLDKEELMNIFSKFENELSVLRSRCLAKTNNMYFFYQTKGIDPVCWVEVSPEAHAQTKMTRASLDMNTDPKWPSLKMRWGYGFNDIVTEDVILDSEEFVIFDAVCEDKEAKKNHVTPYMTCVVPEILGTDVTFIKIWNMAIIIFTILHSFYGPYCLAFSSTSLMESYICGSEGSGNVMDYITDICYIIDVFVEILGAAPVEGLYYKFQDGLTTKKSSPVFYLDLLAAVPLSPFSGLCREVAEVNVVLKCTKIWKVIRYLTYLDNIHPKHVFWFRLMQTCLVLVYGIHFIACTVFIQACPNVQDGQGDELPERDCTDKPNWLWSYILREEDEIVDESITVKSLSSRNPYLISFFYASATLTSAGFGDFSPQNGSEMCWAVMFTLIGFFLICYYTSVLTSALSCIVKPRLEFQQKLLAVRRFMHYYSLPDSLQRRVEQYYEQQHQVRHGINLPHGIEHFFFDAPDYLKNDYLYTATVNLFDGIPLFSKVEPKYIIKMASVMRRFLIPPHVMFLHMGEVRRSMYVIQAGSCGVYEENAVNPKHILEATSHFGIRDLLFGEPSHYTLRTLSYCYIYEITNDQVMDIFSEIFKDEEDELTELIANEREELHDDIEDMYNRYSTLEREQQTDRYVGTPSWIYFRPTKNRSGRRFNQYMEYVSLFKQFRGGNILRYFLQNGTIHPVGAFAKWWSCWMSLVACMTIMLLFMETFMYIRVPYMRMYQWILDSFFYMDIYIKLHWGYYQPNTGLLISHPLKTAGLYIFQGSFFSDVVFATPLELIVFAYGKTNFMGYGDGASWYTKLRWIRFLHVKRIPQIFSIVHGIFVQRTLVLFTLFVSLTLIVCTMVGAVAIYIACPWEANNWETGDQYRMPACRVGQWADSKFGDHAFTQKVLVDVTSRWLYGLYYVSQTLLVIGFGDMITLDNSEIMLLILMSVFGFVFMRCVLADMTAAEVDSDEIRAKFTEAMKTLIQVMKKEKLNKKLISTVHDHLNNMWKRSKGLQPGMLFNDLHPALESDVFRSFVGDTLRKIAVFRDFTPNVLRTLCLYLKKLHFLKGERLMQFGNLEYEMYIIVSGKVWITDKRLSYGCTLGKYETFGESSMLTYAPRRYTAIAATGVEVFVVGRADFDSLIQRYPKVKDILNTLLRNGDYDYFEYKIYEMIDRLKELAGEDRAKQIQILQARTAEIKAVVSAKGSLTHEESADTGSKHTSKNCFVSCLSQVIYSGSDDDGLAFIYLVGRWNRVTARYSICPPLIHPNCGFSKVYFTIIYLFCLMSPALAIYEFCFSKSYFEKKLKLSVQNFSPSNTDEYIQHLIHNIANVFEYFLLSFIVMNLITPFQNDQGLYVKDFTSIALNYIFAYDGMWLDLVSSIPGIILPYDRQVILLTRSLRLYRYYSHYRNKKDDLSVSPFRLKIQLSVSTFVLLAHYIACGFYYIAECEDQSPAPCINTKLEEYALKQETYTWTRKFVSERKIDEQDDNGMQRWRWWLRALYWVVTIISTTGFGDIVPQNVKEMIVGIVCFFSGAFILSIILSSFTAGMTSITKAHRAYLYQVKLLLKYLNNVGLSSIRLGQANAYFDLLWNRCRGRMYHEVTAILPISLRIQVCNDLFCDILNKAFLFNLNNPSFIKQVAARVKHSIYLPGVCIVKEGDLGSSMFVVMKGYVSGISASDSNAMELKKVYKVGDVFGKLPCLFHNEWYRKSYRAEEHTEVLEIQSIDVLHLATVYPEFWKMLKAYVETTYDPDGGSDCILSPQRERLKDIYDLGPDYQKNQDVQQRQKAAKGKKDEDGHGHPGGRATHTGSPTRASRQHPHKKQKKDHVKNPIKFLYDTDNLGTLSDKVDKLNKRKSHKDPSKGKGKSSKPTKGTGAKHNAAATTSKPRGPKATALKAAVSNPEATTSPIVPKTERAASISALPSAPDAMKENETMKEEVAMDRKEKKGSKGKAKKGTKGKKKKA